MDFQCWLHTYGGIDVPKVLTFNIDVPMNLLVSPCIDSGWGDYFLGILHQIYWDFASPIAPLNNAVGLLTGITVRITINQLAPEQLRRVTPALAEWDALHSASGMDRLYQEGSQDYRRGRQVGRVISITWGLFELIGGIGAAWGGSSIIPTEIAGTGAACLLAETGAGLIACGVGAGVTAGTAVVTVSGAAAAVHGAAMLLIIAGNPNPAHSAGGGSGGNNNNVPPVLPKFRERVLEAIKDEFRNRYGLSVESWEIKYFKGPFKMTFTDPALSIPVKQQQRFQVGVEDVFEGTIDISVGYDPINDLFGTIKPASGK